MNVPVKCHRIELILSDVDGVLTDGGVIFDNQGIETKRFHIRDGMGIRLWREAGHKFGIITGRSSHVVKARAAEMRVDVVRQGYDNKLPAAEEILNELQLTREQICFIGDDLLDLGVLRFAGLGVAVADAAEEVRNAADYVTDHLGGHGAVRETVEMILKAQHRWDDVIRKY